MNIEAIIKKSMNIEAITPHSVVLLKTFLTKAEMLLSACSLVGFWAS